MERIETGKIVNTHGIRGELKIQPWADSPESLAGLSVLYLDAAGTQPLAVARARVHQGNVICKFEGVDSIEAAQAYKGRIVYTDKDAQALAPGVILAAVGFLCTGRRTVRLPPVRGNGPAADRAYLKIRPWALAHKGRFQRRIKGQNRLPEIAAV